MFNVFSFLAAQQAEAAAVAAQQAEAAAAAEQAAAPEPESFNAYESELEPEYTLGGQQVNKISWLNCWVLVCSIWESWKSFFVEKILHNLSF